MDARFAEIEIRGYLVGRDCEQHFKATNADDGRVYFEDLVREIDAAEDAGTRTLLLRVDSLGGCSACTFHLYQRLQRFRASRGIVVHVQDAGSGMPCVALASDVVVVDPRGRFVLHSAWSDSAEMVKAVNDWTAQVLAARGTAPEERVKTFFLGEGLVIVDAVTALEELGWGDTVGGLEEARFLAQLGARALPVLAHTRRQRALAARTSPAPPPPALQAPAAGYLDASGAYSGSWVREVSNLGYGGFWVPCSPGAQFYAEAQAKRTAGTGLGGRMAVAFYPTLGVFTGGTATFGSYSTSGSWAKVSVTSAAAPAGTNAAFISYQAASEDTVQFDALYARRVLQPEAVATESITVTAGTGWTLNPSIVRRVGSFVVGQLLATSDGSGSWGAIGTIPAGQRPTSDWKCYAKISDASALASYMAEFNISATDGSIAATRYDDGASLSLSLPTLANGDQANVHFVYPVQ